MVLVMICLFFHSSHYNELKDNKQINLYCPNFSVENKYLIYA